MGIIALSAIASFNVKSSLMDNGQDLSALALANIEALAQGESGSGSCTYIQYREIEQNGCRYYCGLCKETNQWVILYTISCSAR